MQSQLSNAVQRAQHRNAGKQPVDILVETPADQSYTLIAYVTSYFQVLSVAAILASGTISIAVRRTRDGVTTTVGGLSALAASSTRATADATGDDTSLFIPGDTLLITTSANAAGVDLSVTISTQPMGSG
jgi:hypothetical protein